MPSTEEAYNPNNEDDSCNAPACSIYPGMMVFINTIDEPIVITESHQNLISGVTEDDNMLRFEPHTIVLVKRRFSIGDTVYIKGGLGPNRPEFVEGARNYTPGELRHLTGTPLKITDTWGMASYHVESPNGGMYSLNDSWIEIGRSTGTQPVEDRQGVESDLQSDGVNVNGVRFVVPQDAISPQAVDKYIHYFKTNLVIGTELEKHNDWEDWDEDSMTSRLNQALNPTHSYEHLGEYGVYRVEDDGSICGKEVLVIGTNENFFSWHERMTMVHDKLKQYGFYAESDCGMHYHLLCPQKQRIPSIVFKNYIQLLRKYADALIWLTSAQRKEGQNRGLQEYSKFTNFMKRTPTRRTFEKYRRWFLDHCDGGHYEAVNFCQRGYYAGNETLMHIDRNGDLANWHIELRFPDANDSPAVICSIGNLFRAMLIKAVEMSEYGVLTVDSDSGSWTETKDRVFRMSIGNVPTEADMVACKAKARELLDLVRNALLSFDGDSIQVLARLVEKPVSVLRANGKDWEDIEDYYLPPNSTRETAKMRHLRQAIALQAVTGCSTVREWETKMANHLGLSSWETLRRRVYSLKEKRNIVWDKDVGAYLIVY